MGPAAADAPRVELTASRPSGLLDVVGLACSGKRPGEAELIQGGLGDPLDPGRVGRQAAGVRVIGKSSDLHRVLRRAVARDPDQVQLQRLAELVKTGSEDRLLTDAVV